MAPSMVYEYTKPSSHNMNSSIAILYGIESPRLFRWSLSHRRRSVRCRTDSDRRTYRLHTLGGPRSTSCAYERCAVEIALDSRAGSHGTTSPFFNLSRVFSFLRQAVLLEELKEQARSNLAVLSLNRATGLRYGTARGLAGGHTPNGPVQKRAQLSRSIRIGSQHVWEH